MSGFPMMPNMQGMPPVAANPAYIRWSQSMPDNATPQELAAWISSNPAPPKILTPPIPPYVADYIAKEVARQVAVITGVTGATGPSS